MSGVRVTYSGLISLSVSLATVLTGIIFILIVTRRLPQEEFGLWTLIGSLVSYVIIFEPMISFWVSRQIARGLKVGKTALYTSSVFSAISLLIYVIIIQFVSEITDSDIQILLLASILVPLTFVSSTLMGINLGHKPQATSYGVLFFEITKIPAALILVYFLDLGIYGAIMATILALSSKIAIQLFFAKIKLTGIFSKTTVVNWLKLSWLPMYANVARFIFTLDVLIFSALTGSVIGLSYYGAIMTVGNIIAHAGKFTEALYPKLLAGGGLEYIKDNFSKFMFLAIPLYVITLLFSKDALFAINPIYISAFFIIPIYATRSILYSIMGTFYRILQGAETVDESETTSFKLLVRSKLFLVPTLDMIHYSIYVASLFIILSILIPQGYSDVDLIMWWTVTGLIIQIPFTIYIGLLVYRQTGFKIPVVDIGKFSFAGLLMAIVFYFTHDIIVTYEESIFQFFPLMIIELMICFLTYIALVYTIDKKTRIFIKSIFRELLKI